MNDIDKIEQTAADWLARQDAGLSPQEAETLEAWLQTSTAHRIAFLRLEAIWEGADRLAALKQPEPPVSSARAYTSKGFARLAAVAAVALLAAGTAMTLFHYRLEESVYTTGVGQQQALRLSDGTQVQLNTDTVIQTTITRSARTVTLKRGQAYFEVVHDENRPFVIIAGNRRITDIGTKFAVFQKGRNMEIVVEEGRVRVDKESGAHPSGPVFADGGSMLIVRAEETLVAKKTAQEIEDELSWRNGTLVFNHQTLADAAEEFNRYNATHIVVEGKARSIRIGGSFRAKNIEVFAQLVKDGFGLNVNKQNGDIVISSD